MRELWYTAFVLLLLGILAGMTNLKTPSGYLINQPQVAVSNLPPTWDWPTEFTSYGEFEIDLKQAFFDPDGDLLSFTGENVNENKFKIDKSGTYKVKANDGKLMVEQEIIVEIL